MIDSCEDMERPRPVQHWGVRFQTIQALDSLPRVQWIAGEVRNHPNYHLEGRLRPRDQHCLFKYTLRGEGRFRDAAGEHRVPVGCGFLCVINDPATAYYYPPDGRGEWEFVYMCMTGGGIERQVAELVRRDGPIYRLPAKDGLIRRLLACRVNAGAEVAVGAAEGARLVFDLLLTLGESAEKSRETDPANQLVRRAREEVRDNLERDLSVTELAARLQVSREHLTRVFKEHTGLTPHLYIQRRKMLQACRLLKETDLSCKEIAARLGFGEADRFTRAFKSMVRLTPARFRTEGLAPILT